MAAWKPAGNWIDSSAIYRLDAGGAHLLTLNDLLDSQKPYMALLIRLATADLLKQVGPAEMPAALTAAKMTTYTISEKAITFVFEPNKVVPLAVTLYIGIPFTTLKDYLNPNGVLYDLLISDVQITRDPVTGLTAEEALKLGSDKFVGRYQAKKKDDSEVGTREACYVYSALISTRNNLLANALPAERQWRFEQVRELLDRLLKAHFDALEARDGFGTIQLDFRADAAAEKEETLAKVLASLQHPLQNLAARAAAAKALRSAETNLTGLTHVKELEQPADFKQAVQALEKVIADVKTLLPVLPDAAAKQVAIYVGGYMQLDD